MKVKTVDFKGLIKWIVTSEIIFVDPLYLCELQKSLKEQKLGKLVLISK